MRRLLVGLFRTARHHAPRQFTRSWQQRRHIVTTRQFPEMKAVTHSAITRQVDESDEDLHDQILETTHSNPNSLILYVDRSIILKQDESGQYRTPIESKRELEEALLVSHQQPHKKPPFRAHTGHLSLVLTDDDGQPEDTLDISLRPGQTTYAKGEAYLYPELFGDTTSTIKESLFTTTQEEHKKASGFIGGLDGYRRLDIVSIPLSSCDITR